MSPVNILAAVAKAGEVTVADLQGPGRARRYSYPRHVAIVLMHDRYGLNFTSIARRLGNRHYETVKEAYERTKARLPYSIEHAYLLEEAQSLLPPAPAET